LHAVIKMVEVIKRNHRCCLTGKGIKPHNGAEVKRQGSVIFQEDIR